jgi:WD40 repeat protein
MATQDPVPSLFSSTTFEKDVSIKVDDAGIGAASISPSGRDVVLASKSGLFILDLDSPYSPPRHIVYRTDWDVADVQWSPFASRAERIATTANQKALVFNLELSSSANKAPVEFTLHAHDRAITDINFGAHHPDVLATCAVDSYVHTWDLRNPVASTGLLRPKPVYSVADFQAGATQVRWNRKNEFVLASSHDKFLRIWDTRHGAVPLTTITAHQTKIYGIDWHRSDPTKILTCSLDKTIKLWDQVGVKHEITEPCRVIHTNHPVWRARHTPFPNGILAMPQRGSAALNLYTHAAGSSPGPVATVSTPAHSFQAHEDEARVQEFLWRTRGSVDDGFDNREFQLVSWGTDRHLHLYTVSSDLLLKTVGFRKGDPVSEAPSTTRKHAKYVTYRDDPPRPSSKSRPTPTTQHSSQQGTLSSLLQAHSQADIVLSAAMREDPQRATMTAGTIRHSAFGRVVNNITWMDGVKVGERQVDKASNDRAPGQDDQYRWTIRDDLAAEVSHVGKTYSKVTFESVEIPDRRITVSFQGPWGDVDNSIDRRAERKLAFIRLTIMFPDEYPRLTEIEGDDDGAVPMKIPNPLQIEFHKTTAAIDEATLTKLKEDMNQIANHRATIGRDALDAVVCYGLGERGLEDSLVIPGGPGQDDDSPEPEALPGEESSSDDDDEDQGLGIGQDAMNSSLSNANIPVPIQSSIRFSASGVLVLVRIPSKDPSQSSLSQVLRLPRLPPQALNRNEIFESFGRLTMPHEYGSDSPTSSNGSWDWSSSPSSASGSETEAGVPQSRFQPPIAWQNPPLRFRSKTSHPSSIGPAKGTKSLSVVCILPSSADDFVPSKRCLAEEYRIFGDGPQVCSHNAEVARRFGFEDLADIWELCRLILDNDVPLEILPQQHRREQVLVLARRALVRIKRKDSGLDLQFDEADTVTNPKLKGRIKWGNHSVVTWLIPALFEYFEKLADTQMLAMLSCIFSEPATREGVTSVMARMRHSNLPMSMEAPAFSLDYFSSEDAAWSLFKPTISIPSTPAHSRYATPVDGFGWHRLQKNLDTYGSHGSSNGPWGSDNQYSEPVTPYSTGNTPPILSRAGTQRSTAVHTPFSSSPEQPSHIHKKSSTANFASAFAGLARPFANAISSSPPVKSRNEADLSTSAPTSGVTWGTTTFYSSGSNDRSNLPPTAARSKHGKRASFGQADQLNVDYYSDSDSEYGDTSFLQDGTASEYTAPLTAGSDESNGSVKVTLKNQDKFDDEACVSAPLLDMRKEWLYRAWREQYAEMLGCWGLVSKRAEVLKFNGLINYFPVGGSRSSSKAGSMHLGLKSDSQPTSAPMSRTSTLAPPSMPQFNRRSPLASPRHFSFNPEATEFQPGGAAEAFDNDSTIAPPLDVFISSEQYLRLSIPNTEQEEDVGTGIGGFFDSANDSKFLKPRPSISRQPSKNSSIAGAKSKKEPIYSCSICWIRVSGRFFLCPSCGHVAHFDCMSSSTSDTDSGLGHVFEEGECVVGCGCGCGFNDDIKEPEVIEVEEKVRRWEEKGGWLPQDHEDVAFEGEIEVSGFQNFHGEGTTAWGSPERKRNTEKEGRKSEGRKSIRRAISAR